MVKKNKKTAWNQSSMDILDEQLNFLDEYGSTDDLPRLELDFGDTEVRILPAWDDRGYWFNRYSMHWNLPIEGDRTSFRCARDLPSPRECLFCESAEMLRDRPDLFSKWRAKPRYDFNVVTVDEPSVVKILSLPPTAAESILRAAKLYGDPSHPETGYNFIITKKKTGKNAYNVEYSVWPHRESSELEEWGVLEDLIALDEIFPAPSLDAQKEALQLDTSVGTDQAQLTAGGVVEDDDDDEDVIEVTVVNNDDDDDEEEVEEKEEKISVRDMLSQRLKGSK